MPRASRRLLRKEVWEEIHNVLWEVISSQDRAGLENFLSEFLTREEKTMFAKRLALYLLILGDYSETNVKEALKVSHETIRQARTVLGMKSVKFRDNLTDWISSPQEPKKENKLLKMIELSIAAKSDMRARAKLASGQV